MSRLLLLILVACGTTRIAQVPAQPGQPMPAAPATPSAPAAASAPALDEATLVSRTRAWLDAFDRFDAQAFAEPVGRAFVLFEDSRFMDAAIVGTSLESRKQRGLPRVTRTFRDEKTFIYDSVAIYVGLHVEHVPAFGDGKASDQEGWNTVVWAREGGRWVIAQWQWQLAGVTAEKNRWNEIYRNATGFNKKPNQLLVDTVKGRKPGTALDVGMGQGRNAIFLASQGWKTTGVDISDEGIKQAKDEAARRKVKLDAVLEDFSTYDVGTARWDLVTLIYAGAEPKEVEKIKPSIKKGGLFVCEYFHAESEVAKTGAGGCKTGELAALFADGFKILRDEVVEDNADWAGMRKTKLVRFVAQKR